MTEIYLNASGHGRPDASVLRRMATHLEREIAIGPDRARDEAAGELDAVRRDAAALIGADPARTGLAASTCATWFEIVARLPMAGRRVLVAPHEWYENLAALNMLAADRGFTVEVLPEIDFARPDLAAWRDRIDGDVAAICLPMVTSVGGAVYPLAEIGRMARPEGALLIVDAAQAVGQVPIDVAAFNCDILVATTRKWLRAPRQTALFCIRDGVLGADGPLDPWALEPSDVNIALRLGMGEALGQARARGVAELGTELSAFSARIRSLARELGIETLWQGGGTATAVTLSFEPAALPAIQASVAAAGCLVKWPDARRDEPHAPEARLDRAFMRVSPHLYNSTCDLDCLFDAIRRVMAPA
ncbi:MAG: aminotransferase class V-fold PLP-dependent enzyme [Pseudomonadota bacterium]